MTQPTTRRRPMRVGTILTTRRFRIRFDGVQGELFNVDSFQWTILKPGHPIDETVMHLPTFITSRKAVVAAACALYEKP